jgi:hypothetical protein
VRFAICALILALPLVPGCSEETSRTDDGGSEDAWTGKCQMDKSIDFDTAIELKMGDQHTGWICPKTDKDFFKISIPASSKLLKIKLDYVSTAPRIQLAYRLFDAQQKPLANSATGIDNKFDALHCLEKGGDMYLMIQDQGDDGYDAKISYTLSYSAEADKDTGEPGNNDKGGAKPLTGSATGYISCQNDVDYYKITVGSNQLVKIGLQAAGTTNVDLEYTIYDSADKPVALEAIPDGTKPDAKLDVTHAITPPGTYYLVVRDKDNNEADAKTGYTLTYSTLPENDNQDKGNRNDTPATATPISSGQTFTGQIASKGDVDFFVANVGAASPSSPWVMEVTLSVTGGKVPLDPSFAYFYPDAGTACTKDACCKVLAGSCKDSSECIRSTYNCVNKGDQYCNDATCAPSASATCAVEKACAGATLCLPSKKCAAEHTFRSKRNVTGSTVVKTSQLLIHPGPWYIRVSDQQDDEYEHGRVYTLNVKYQADPDGAKELDNEMFGNRCFLVENKGIEEDELNVTMAKTKPKKIAMNTWTQGYISYEGDIDFYTFDNPCPNADCTLAIDYEAGPGCPSSGAPLRYCQDAKEVQKYMGLEFRYWIGKAWEKDGEQWTGFAATAGASGTWGAPSTCVYSYAQHGSKPYYFVVDDMGMNYWSWSCYYKFKVRKVADGCAAPCKVTAGNCGT